MGGTYMTETLPGATAAEALAALLVKFKTDWPPDEENEDPGWLDPQEKCATGYVQVWNKPVKDEAVEWMRGWAAQHPPASVDPDDKWGPWMTFSLASGGWHFFGWVNT